MLKGGYQIVDFDDTDIKSDGGATIMGIYEQIEGSYRKALLASGIVIDGVEHRDTWIDPTHAENSYTFTAVGKTFTVTHDDKVTIA